MKKIWVVAAPGLLLVSTATASSAGVSQEFTNRSSVKITGDGTVTVYRVGKAVQNFTLPEGEEYSIETPSGRIHIGRMTKEEVEKAQAEDEVEMNELLEIAKEDSKIQELVDGKDYEVVAMGKVGKIGEEDTAILTLDVEGKYYKVTIDLHSETVESVEQQSSSMIEFCVGPECEIHGTHRPEM